MSILERLPHANVKRLEFGRGIANNVGAQFGRYVVATMSIPWNVVSQRIGKPPAQVIEVTDMDLESAIALEASTPPCDTVVAVGGGQSMDMGKYIAWKRGIPLVNIPTIVSTNAYVTQAVGVRNRGKVEYIGEVTPELVLVDYELIRTAVTVDRVRSEGRIAPRQGRAALRLELRDLRRRQRPDIRNEHDAA